MINKHHSLLFGILLLCIGAVTAGVVEFSPLLLRYVSGKWGEGAVDRLQAWRNTELEGLANRPNTHAVLNREELQLFNRFWNKVPYFSDQQHWGMADYWATPIETLASNGADCEDYAIAKYFSLKELGVPPGSLRITYVRSLKIDEAHMVLAYYPAPGADPYILDNLTEKLAPASERDDLQPVYSFNDDDLWTITASFKGKSGQIRLWNELLARMEKERRM